MQPKPHLPIPRLPPCRLLLAKPVTSSLVSALVPPPLPHRSSVVRCRMARLVRVMDAASATSTHPRETTTVQLLRRLRVLWSRKPFSRCGTSNHWPCSVETQEPWRSAPKAAACFLIQIVPKLVTRLEVVTGTAGAIRRPSQWVVYEKCLRSFVFFQFDVSGK